MKSIHILNSQKLKENLTHLKIEGKLIVWKEKLHKGNVIADVASDAFWKNRYNYFEKTHLIDKLTYFNKNIKPIVCIEDLPKNTNLFFWASDNLKNQINLLALCTYALKYYRKDINYFVVYTINKNYLKANEIIKIKLSRNALLFAKQAWELWAKKDLKQLQEFNFNREKRFNQLQPALTKYINARTKAT